MCARVHMRTPAHLRTPIYTHRSVFLRVARGENVCKCVQVCASVCRCVRVGASVCEWVQVCAVAWACARATQTHTHEHTHYNNGNWIEGGSTNERKQGLERGGLKYWGGFGYRISKVGPHENQLPETPQLFSKFQCYGHPT